MTLEHPMSADPSHPAQPSGSQAGSSEEGRRPTGEEPAGTPPDVPQRWSAQRKIEVVMRLLKGESIDALSRETQQTAAKLSEWRERFLTGAEANLKGRPEQDEQEAFREERRRLQAKVGEQAMEIELLHERCDKLEAGLPPGQRRSKR
jgi:predicted RNase H-like nuclease (RuvC/YqgF family)